MSKTVFISYTHDSDHHKERVAGLANRLREDGFEAHIDQHVNGTPDQGWPRWMLDQIEEADFVLVVCTETYYRRFRGHEEPGKGKGGDWEGAFITQEIYDARSRTTKFVPVLLSGGLTDFIPEPLRSHTYYELTKETAYQELVDFLLEVAGIEPAEIGELEPRTRKRAPEFLFDEPATHPEQRIATTRLPKGAPKLFGRKKELQALDDAWKDPTTNLVTLVAWGGVGKTSLVHKWVADLATRNHDGADYFDWSFYSQGTREEGGISADAFVDKALRFFGDEAMAESPRSPWDKGSRLAELVAKRRTLLVLDGLEPLQHPPGPLAGELKDPAITALLKGLAARNAGLCVVTTRERVEDLSGFEESTAPRWELEHLSTAAGVQLLKSVGVHGPADELEALVEDVHGHALTLNLLGRFLDYDHGGDVRKRDRIDLSKANLQFQGGHAFRVMEAYERWFMPRRSWLQRFLEFLGVRKERDNQSGRRQLAILRLLGLFDRPAESECLAALRREPAIPGLTEPLMDLNEDDWNMAVGELAEYGLLAPREEGSEGLDAHPLVREHFGNRLRQESPRAWKEAHSRLFDRLKDTTEHQPDTLEGLRPLYQAVVHGCHAERHQEACDEVYRDRILRGTGRSEGFYTVRKLCAFGADLGAVACFFQSPWSLVSPSLIEAAQVWLLNEAAIRLRALGRLKEAIEPLRAGLKMAIQGENWENAAQVASNLSELELTLGNVSSAERDAGQAVDLANRSGSAFLRMALRTTLADALHKSGRREEALTRFQESEAMQADWQPEYPLLYSTLSFRYCDLLLADAEGAAAADGGGIADCIEDCGEVEGRASLSIEWQEKMLGAPVLDFALHHLTLGRARLYRAILEGSSLDEAKAEIEQAVNGLRAAGQLQFVPLGLLARAWLRSVQGDAEAARADLAEAQEIAERGPMPLHLADIHLYRARLFHDRDALAEARRLVKKHGYGRREPDLQDLEEASSSWPSDGSRPLE